MLCLKRDFSNFSYWWTGNSKLNSHVSFGGISGAPRKDPEKSRTPESTPRECQIFRDRRQWRYAKHTLNIQEFQLHFLHTKENERKTQGKGEFIFRFLLCCHLSLLFSGLFLCWMCPFKPLGKGFMLPIRPALLGARKFSKNVLLYNAYIPVVTLLPRLHLTVDWEVCFIRIYIY